MALTRINGNLISSGTITGNLFLSNTITGDKLANTGVSSGTYGGATQIPVVTVGTDGRLSYAANVAFIGSQWTTNASAIHYTTGSVGIGTTAPGAYLLAVGDGSSNRGRIMLKGATSGNYPEINIDDSMNASGKNYQLYSTGGALVLADQTAGATRFQIGSSGQFGIGGATYGSSGQILTSGGSSAAPTWTTPSAGALVFLQSVNGTNASSWDFSSVFSSTYDQYMVHVQILTTSLTTRLDWRVKRSGSFVTSDYDQYVAYAASTSLNFLNNSSQPYGTNAYTTNSGLLSMQLMISNVNSTARRFVVIGHGLDVNFVTISGSTQNTLATSQGIAFYLDGGNTVGTGNIKIYGLTNS